MKKDLNKKAKDVGGPAITNDSFEEYKLPEAYAIPIENNALSVEQLRVLINYSCEDEKELIARDVFVLSFLLMEANTADMFEGVVRNERFEYERQKTRSKRKDRTFMSVFLEPEAIEYLEKYKDATGERAFSFYNRYSTSENFNTKVNADLKPIMKKLGFEVPLFSLYSARKTFYTLLFDLGVNDSIVAEYLNHKGDEKTELARTVYRKPQKDRLDKYNRLLLDYVFQKGEFTVKNASKITKMKQKSNYSSTVIKA
jgi:Phage integrase family.